MKTLEELLAMNAEHLEKPLHTLLPYFFVILWMVTLAIAVCNYRVHHGWNIGDWLINYHGGFVRRGLTGEIVISLARLTSLNVGIIVVMLQSLCYGIYFYFTYLLLRKVYLLPYAMLVVSPFIFTFQINQAFGYRKEIIFFALLSFLAWSKCALRRNIFEKIFFIALPFYALAVLSHEMLILFIPYLLILYLIGGKPSHKQCGSLALCLLPALVSFLFCLYFKGTHEQVRVIYNTLGNMNYAVPAQGGAIFSLSISTWDAICKVRVLFLYLYAAYLPAIALALVAFMPIYSTLLALFTDKLLALLFLLSLVGTVILAIVAEDWGRFIYIHLVSLFILALVADQSIQNREKPDRYFGIPMLTVFLVLIWALTFRIPGHGGAGIDGDGVIINKSITEINYLRAVYYCRRLIHSSAPSFVPSQ